MPTFVEKYTQDQRDAVAYAYEDRGVKPARVVVALAAAGELEWKGEKLEPFDMPESSVRDLARDMRKRRAGQRTSQLATKPHRDAVENLRQRLVNVADALLLDLENTKAADIDPERLRQVTRCVRETAALPGRDDPRPAAPGAKVDGQREGGETKGGLAGQLLDDARRTAAGAAPAQPGAAPTPPASTSAPGTPGDTSSTSHVHAAPAATHSTDSTRNNQDDAAPGALVREHAARLGFELPAG